MNAETRVYIDRLGLHVSPDTPLSKLSIAQQQQVEIAKAVVAQSTSLDNGRADIESDAYGNGAAA